MTPTGKSPHRTIDGVDGREHVRANFRSPGYVIIESLADVHWYSPLLAEEERALRKLIDQIRFVKIDQEREQDYFAVSLTALTAGDLERLTLHVCTRDIRDLSGELFRRKGSISLAGKTTLLNGITENRVPAADAGTEDTQPVPAPNQWLPIEDQEEVRAIIGDLNGLIFPVIDPQTASLSRKPLPFYAPFDLDPAQEYKAPALYRIDVGEDGSRQTAFVVWKPGVVEMLDWTSTPMHHLNERFGDTLSARFAESSEHVKEYLRFFCDFVCGEEGPFMLVEGMDHPRFASIELDDETRQSVLKELAPMDDTVAGEEHYSIRNAMIWYGTVLFRCDFTVTPDGATEMVEDSGGLVELPEGVTDWSATRDSTLKLLPHPLVSHALQQNSVFTTGVIAAPNGETDDKIKAYEKQGAVHLGVDERRLEYRILLGDVDLSDSNLPRGLVFSYCRFRGDVDLRSMVCDSRVHFVNCVFEKTLRLDGARIAGGLSIWNSTVIGVTPTIPLAEMPRPSIGALQAHADHITLARVATVAGVDLGQTRIAGDVFLVGLTTSQISLIKARVEGRVAIRSIVGQAYPIRGNLSLSYLNAESLAIHGLTVRGNVDVDNASIAQSVLMERTTEALEIEGSVDMEYLSASTVLFGGADIGDRLLMRFSTIRQYVLLNRHVMRVEDGKILETVPTKIRCGSGSGENSEIIDGLNLYGAEIEKNYVYLSGVEIEGNVNLRFARIGTALFVRHEPGEDPRNRIAGGLELAGMSAPRGVYIEGAFIGKDLGAPSLHTGEFRIKAVERSGAEGEITCVEIGGSLDLSQAKITEDATIVGLVAGAAEKPESVANDTWSLNLRRAEINGNLSLYMNPKDMADRFGSTQIVRQPVVTRLPHGINLTQADIDADLNLSHVQCPDSVMELKDARVGHDILIQTPVHTDGPTELAGAGAFLGNALECGGDVDLTGLELGDGGRPEHLPHGCQPGSVMLEQAKIAGRLITYKKTTDKDAGGETEDITAIPGCLNLKASEIGQVDISWHRFADACGDSGDDAATSQAEKCGIVMEQAKIGTLSVTKDGERYPVPVSLKFMEVKWWDFNGSSGTAQDYISFLSKDETIQSHTYYAIENTLLNQGQEDAADDVHIAMHQRIEQRKKEKRTQQSPLNPVRWWRAVKSGAKQFLLGFISGYGTKVLRPSMIIFFWWLISGFIFAYAGNIVPSEEGLAATHTEMRPGVHPVPQEWHMGDGLWVAIRYHLPIVAFDSLDEWEPDNDSQLVIPKPTNISEALVRLPISAESYAFTVVALHYILLPMAVFAASRKVLRRREVG